jgi:hypothetical protein
MKRSFFVSFSSGDDPRILISVLQREVGEITPTKVTQAAILDNNKQMFGPDRAVDKDRFTKAASTVVYGAAWMKIEFGKIYFFHRIKIYYRFYTNWFNPSEKCAQSVDNFKSCVDINNNVDVSVYQGGVKQKSCGTLQLTYGLDQSDQIYTMICNAKGDNIKLSKTTGNIAVFEIAIVGSGKI